MQAVVDAGRLKAHSMSDFWARTVSESSSDEDAPVEDPYRQAASRALDSDSDASDDAGEMDTDSDGSEG